MESTLMNQEFTGSIKTLRKILPKLSFGLLIGTYLVSALIMGIFHAQNAPDITLKIAAFLVPLAIQIGRGALVFFFQLNPINLEGRFSFGMVAATILLLLSLWEAYTVMNPYGLSWIISVSTLMLIGYIIEIMLLREVSFATKWELYQNQELWQNLQQFNQIQKGINPTQSIVKELPIIEEAKTEVENTKSEIEFFYGIPLDTRNPFLPYNLNRLESRFRKRYETSLANDKKRKAEGKPSHKTTLKSIQQNLERLKELQQLKIELNFAN